MQDIVFYAAVLCETQGIVRDSANARNQSAPVLVLGVSACLKMRLFAACNVATPYPVASCSGISDWIWRMDADFERDTPSKLVADADGIFVHTVTDTVDGKTVNFTEFVIPISNMNTQELTAWLGNEKKRSGLIGELVGYDSEGNAVFVLQIDDFTVRNRVGGLGDPTAIEQEVATRSQTVQMIRAAVSSSAATKQDRLTSANAGANISIDENGVISNTYTYSLPSATTGSKGGVILATAAETKSGSNATKAITPAGFLSAISGNDPIIAKSAIQTFQPIIELGSASNVSLKSGGAYRLSAVSGNHYLTVSDVPADKYGTDAHVELFVGGTTLVHVLDPLILMDALIPNAVNDCVIKFRDGTARLFVEDHAYGYVVTVAGGTEGTVFGGSLHYGLTGAAASYIAFANSLNGQTVILPGTASVNRAVNVVGNGYTQTVISGGISCTSKTTFSNLGMNGVSVLGGTMTLGDVYIPSGATVSVSDGGGLVIERVSGDGGTIDLGGSYVRTNSHITAEGCTFTSGNNSTLNGGAFYGTTSNTVLELKFCTFTGNHAVRLGGAVSVDTYATVSFSDCVISGNSNDFGYTDTGIFAGANGIVQFMGGNTVSDRVNANSGTFIVEGSNAFLNTVIGTSSTVLISSGAIVDLTGNTNNPTINPGSGVTFAPGGATVYPSAGSASAYMLGGVTVPKLGNTNVIDLGGTHTSIRYGSSAVFSSVVITGAANVAIAIGGDYDNGVVDLSGCTFTNNAGNYGAAVNMKNSSSVLTATQCVFRSNSATDAAALTIWGGSASFDGCEWSDNSAYPGAPTALSLANGASVVLTGCSFGAGQTIVYANSANLVLEGSNVIDNVSGASGVVSISSGAIVTLAGSIAPGSGGITLYGGLSENLTAIIGSGGVSRTFEECEIHGSTINSAGLIYGATIYPGQYGHDVVYTEDGGTTSSSTLVGADSSFAVPGALMRVEKYD